MKKLGLLAIIFIALNFNSFAQISAGGGLSFGSGTKTLGINLRGQYTIMENIDVVGGLTFFFPKTTSQSLPFIGTIETKESAWTFDIDGHYNFAINDQFKFYPVGGLNITGVSVKVNGAKSSDTKIGLNVGIGAAYSLSEKLGAFAEAKYIISNADQAVITAGVLYGF